MVPTLTGDHQNRITDYTAVAVYEPKSALEENWDESIVKNAIRAGASKSSHAIVEASCTASGKQCFGTLQASCADKQWLGNQEAASGDYHVLQKAKPPRKYIIRRLTPVECARLQGFPDWWGKLQTVKEMNDEDYDFWCNVLFEKR